MSVAPPVVPTFNPIDAYPELVQARQALADHDWPAVRDACAALPADGRTGFVRLATTGPEHEEFLTGLVERDPSDTLAATLLAANLIDKGWTARTAARAKYVSREQWKTFYTQLDRAEQLLIDVTAREPGNAAAWTQRLITARGLSLGQAEAQRRYGHLARQHPNLLPAQTQMLQQLCPKWSGSFERMHAFARERMLAAPEGAPNGVLVLEGHLEVWLTLDDQAGTAYLRSPDVRGQIEEAAHRSVLHPAFDQPYGWVSVRSTFAMVFCLQGEWTAAGEQFERLGRFGSNPPWASLGDGVAQFLNHRARALRVGVAR